MGALCEPLGSTSRIVAISSRIDRGRVDASSSTLELVALTCERRRIFAAEARSDRGGAPSGRVHRTSSVKRCTCEEVSR